MLRSHIVLLIAICPSDGDVKPGGPLGAFREEQALNRHRVSSSPFLSSSSFHTTQLHYTNSYTYSHPNLNFLQYTIQTDTRPSRKVVCPSGAWFENRPYLTPSIHLPWNPKRIIVQWVGIETHIFRRWTTCTYLGDEQPGIHSATSKIFLHYENVMGGSPGDVSEEPVT